MANGDIITNVRNCFEATLLDGQTTTNAGTWVEVPWHLNLWSATSTNPEEGAADAVLAIHVSNAITKPSDATAGEDIWFTFTTPIFSNEAIGGYKYVKCAKTQGTTPVASTVRFRATPSR